MWSVSGIGSFSWAAWSRELTSHFCGIGSVMQKIRSSCILHYLPYFAPFWSHQLTLMKFEVKIWYGIEYHLSIYAKNGSLSAFLDIDLQWPLMTSKVKTKYTLLIWASVHTKVLLLVYFLILSYLTFVRYYWISEFDLLWPLMTPEVKIT